MKFKTELSEEHRRQICRFRGLPFDDVTDRALRGWIAFRRWLHAEEERRATH
jgi:hypothetical protein